MGRNSHHLPEELMEEILLRLPVKSLLRFKCVCKSWYSLISDRSFADNHLHFNKKINPSSTSLFLTCVDRNRHQRFAGLITICNNDDDRDANGEIPCVVEDLDLTYILDVLGILGFEDAHVWRGSHCNGIIALNCRCCGTTIFYNPAIRDFKRLPKRQPLRGFLFSAFGFGYDSKTNDYKFVRILFSYKTKEFIAEVYNLGSDCWKQIRIDVEFRESWLGDLGVYCKGVYFWKVPKSKSVPTILSFDMCNDEFHTTPLPNDVEKENGLPLMELVVRNESVTILLFRDRMPFSFDMWVMDDYVSGVEGPSWTKHLAIRLFKGIEMPLIFWKSDELLMSTADEQLVSYNLGTKKLKNLPLFVLLPGIWHADFYMPTLVSVN